MPVRLPAAVPDPAPAPVAAAAPEPVAEDPAEPEPEPEPEPPAVEYVGPWGSGGPPVPAASDQPAGMTRAELAAAAGARADRSELAARTAEPAGDDSWPVLAEVGELAHGRGRLVVRILGAPDGPWLDVRRFVAGQRYSGPTRKGWAVPAELADPIARLILDAGAAAELLEAER